MQYRTLLAYGLAVVGVASEAPAQSPAPPSAPAQLSQSLDQQAALEQQALDAIPPACKNRMTSGQACPFRGEADDDDAEGFDENQQQACIQATLAACGVKPQQLLGAAQHYVDNQQDTAARSAYKAQVLPLLMLVKAAREWAMGGEDEATQLRYTIRLVKATPALGQYAALATSDEGRDVLDAAALSKADLSKRSLARVDAGRTGALRLAGRQFVTPVLYILCGLIWTYMMTCFAAVALSCTSWGNKVGDKLFGKLPKIQSRC